MAGKLELGFGLGWVRLSWLGMAGFESGLGSAGFGGQLGVAGFRDAFCRAAFRGKDEDSLSRLHLGVGSVGIVITMRLRPSLT